EVLADPRALGARVARARCSPYDSHRAYGAIADLLRRALAIGASAPTEIAHRTITETLPGLEPETTKLVLAALGYGLTLPPLSGDTRRKLLDRAIRDLILRVARTQPVILAITDVQWSDTASQAVLTAMDPRDRRRCRTRRRQPARGCEPHERPARRTADVAPPARRTGNARRTSSAARDRGGRARDRSGDHPRDRRAWCRRRREPWGAP